MTERIQLCGEIPEPRHWPLMPMSVYGTIPGREEPLFRIVFASSVRHLVGGEFSDGFTGYRAVPTYEYIGDKWIMEKWVSAFEFTRQTELQYKAHWEDPTTHLCLTGPYPRNGSYQWVWTFNSPEQIGAAGIVAALVNKAKFNSGAANRAAIEQAAAKAKQDKFQENFARMKDKQRVSGIRAANIGGRVKALKSFPEIQDARALGLPTRGARQIKATSGELQVAGY
jgi:hypothetical protein